MDYKYIEQLLERYWECQTTLEEEAILRKFFAQSDIPASLLPYASLFQVEEEMAEERLGDDFDERILARIGEKSSSNVKVVRMTLAARLAPFYKAAAMVAIVLSIGMAAQHGWDRKSATEETIVAEQPGDSTTMEILPATTAETVQPTDSLMGTLSQ